MKSEKRYGRIHISSGHLLGSIR